MRPMNAYTTKHNVRFQSGQTGQISIGHFKRKRRQNNNWETNETKTKKSHNNNNSKTATTIKSRKRIAHLQRCTQMANHFFLFELECQRKICIWHQFIYFSMSVFVFRMLFSYLLLTFFQSVSSECLFLSFYALLLFFRARSPHTH